MKTVPAPGTREFSAVPATLGRSPIIAPTGDGKPVDGGPTGGAGGKIALLVVAPIGIPGGLGPSDELD